MKSVVVMICMASISALFAGAAIGRPSSPSTNDGAASGVAIQDPVPSAKRGHGKQTARQTQDNLANLKGTVVSEMRATKAFVKDTVVKPGNADRGLMLVAAVGMIVLQLRRKHKSLPQRPIAPYA